MNRPPDIVLIGCVKLKRSGPAPAKDLYTSPLFRKERAYAEATRVPWFVLSAQHGLVAPTTVLAPYDLQLSKTPRAYRSAWGSRVVAQLEQEIGPIAGKTVEVRAGAAYLDAIRDGLRTAGAIVAEPLRGLTLGQRLAWHNDEPGDKPSRTTAVSAPDVGILVDKLSGHAPTQTPAELLATGGAGLRLPGLYSWWVDQDGANDLTAGLGHRVAPGLIYAGLAGATRSRSGRKSSNTLWGRLQGMHLGVHHEFSTFRLSLGAILASAGSDSEINEARLTEWMHRHLRVVAVPVEGADSLDEVESAVLGRLDPPLNLAKMPRTAGRDRLTGLRRSYARTGKAR